MVDAAPVMSGSEDLRRIAREAASRLTYTRASGQDTQIVLPVLYPTGRAVAVKLLGGPATFTVTDDGLTTREADLMGASDIFKREARKTADEYSIRFNDWELFEAECSVEQLPGTIAVVAHAASLTLIRTCDKFAERFASRRREELASRLARVFGERYVAKDIEVLGASNKHWSFDAGVALPSGRDGLFSVVLPSPISVVFSYSKIDDLSRSETPPFLGAVLDGKFAADDKALLQRAATRLFSLDDDDERFRLAA